MVIWKQTTIQTLRTRTSVTKKGVAIYCLNLEGEVGLQEMAKINDVRPIDYKQLVGVRGLLYGAHSTLGATSSLRHLFSDPDVQLGIIIQLPV